MSMEGIKVQVTINNMSKTSFDRDGYIVARYVVTDGKYSLWYYGFYNDEDRATDVANEIGNGMVFKYSKEEINK